MSTERAKSGMEDLNFNLGDDRSDASRKFDDGELEIRLRQNRQKDW